MSALERARQEHDGAQTGQICFCTTVCVALWRRPSLQMDIGEAHRCWCPTEDQRQCVQHGHPDVGRIIIIIIIYPR